MSQTRRLAAILAADVAGYSRLIGADEEGTLNRLRSIRAELIDPKITEHRGRIVKTTGDGLLVEFSSVVDALRCATEWQRSMAERNVAAPGDNRIKFRIGVHQGDIVVEIAPTLTLPDTPPNTANPIRDYSEHKVDTAADAGAGATSRVECH
jgi:class 3 adenylate cyclase